MKLHLIKAVTVFLLGLSITAAWASEGVSSKGAHGRQDPHAALTADQHLTVALQHRQEGREAEAIFTLDKAIYAYPDHARLHLVRGSLLLQRQQISRALEDFEAAVRLDSDNAEAYVNRAQAYRHFDRIDDALADLNKAVELEPDLVPARFNRGSLRFDREDYEGALTDFEHCVAVAPHTPALYFNRAATYDAMGRRAQAIADIERFLELTKNEQWQQAGRDLLRRWNEEQAGMTQAGQAGEKP